MITTLSLIKAPSSVQQVILFSTWVSLLSFLTPHFSQVKNEHLGESYEFLSNN